jgi:hypothetical protein
MQKSQPNEWRVVWVRVGIIIAFSMLVPTLVGLRTGKVPTYHGKLEPPGEKKEKGIQWPKKAIEARKAQPSLSNPFSPVRD